MPARIVFAGMMSQAAVCWMASRAVTVPFMTSYMVAPLWLSAAIDMDRLPCGSQSIVSTLKPCFFRPAARMPVVVVFATPPFWLASANIADMFSTSFNFVKL